MRDLLFLAHRIPYPPDRGDKIRSWHLLKRLGQSARVHLACFADDEADAAHLPALREAMGGRLGSAHVEVRRAGKAAAAARALAEGRPVSLAAFDSKKMRGFVADTLRRQRIGHVFAFSGQMAQFVPAGPRFVMDFGDVDSAKFEAYAESGPAAWRWLMRREARLLAAFEASTAARADASLFVSEAEAALFEARTGHAAVALSNGIDLDFFDPAAAFPRLAAAERGERPLILFTGQMDYRPNVEAAVCFARDVLPLLPGTRFCVAGRNPAPEVAALRRRGVIVTGEVADMRAWLAAAEIVVAPLAIARGIQNKVLEAMAMARPVVASPPAFEGIDAVAGRDLLVADGAEVQAVAIRRLLDRPDEAAALAAAGRRRMETHYRWDARLAPLAEIVFPEGERAAA